MERADRAGVGETEGERHERRCGGDDHVDLGAPVVVVLDRVLGQVHAEALGQRTEGVAVGGVGARVDRHRVRREEVHAVPVGLGRHRGHLVGERVRLLVARGQEPEAPRLRSGQDQRRRGRAAGHRARRGPAG